MTFDFGTWMRKSILPATRAESMWRIISRDPKEIVFTRNGVDLDPQIVRVEHDNTSRQVQSGISTVSVQVVKVYGVRDHSSDAVADTDIEVGDRFWLGQSADGPQSQYEVKQVIPLPGQIQALAERISE